MIRRRCRGGETNDGRSITCASSCASVNNVFEQTRSRATKEGALTRPNGRRHQLAAGSFCERCEQRRSASVILTPSTTAMDAAIAGFAFPRVRTALLFGDLNGVPVAGLRADQKGPPRDGTFGYRRPGAQRVSRAENPLWKLPVDAPTSVGVVRRAIAPVLALGSRGYRWRR